MSGWEKADFWMTVSIRWIVVSVYFQLVAFTAHAFGDTIALAPLVIGCCGALWLVVWTVRGWRRTRA